MNKQNNTIVALKRAIVATFDEAKWRELSYLTDSVELVSGHSRLLRSLSWGDSDYPSCVLEVLPRLLGDNLENLAVVAEFANLEVWLRENDLRMYQEIYGIPVTVPLDQVEAAGTVTNVSELNRHAIRIRRGISDDPEQAVGSAKELLETVLRTVLGEHGKMIAEDIPALLKRSQRQLSLDPKQAGAAGRPGSETLMRTLSNLGQVVVGVAELRNLYGTGHGRSKAPGLEAAHARLVVNAAVTIATFLLEVWLAQEEGTGQKDASFQ